MGRPRKHDIGLPSRVYIIHGTYWLRPIARKAVKLTRVTDGHAAMHAALAVALRGLDAPKDTVVAAVASWQSDYLARTQLADETRKTYERIAAALAHSFSAFRIGEVTTPDVQGFIDNWKDRPRMGNEVRKVTKQIFDWAIRKGQIRVNPVATTIKNKLIKRKVYIPDSALRAILHAMVRDGGNTATHNGVMTRAFVELCYLTGQRAQDIRELRWADIEAAMQFQPSKTSESSGKRVEFTVTPELKRVLDDVKAFVEARNAALGDEAVHSEFVIHRLDGKPFAQTGVRAAWRRAISLTDYKDSGYTIKDLRPKSLTDAKKAFGAGNMEMVQEMAAHSSITTTESYMRNRNVATVVSPLTVPKSKPKK